MAERAIAAAVPEEFVTALVSKTLGELPTFVKKRLPPWGSARVCQSIAL